MGTCVARSHKWNRGPAGADPLSSGLTTLPLPPSSPVPTSCSRPAPLISGQDKCVANPSCDKEVLRLRSGKKKRSKCRIARV